MKRKNDLKKEPFKTIDPAVLEEILGSVESACGAGKSVAVIRQEPFKLLLPLLIHRTSSSPPVLLSVCLITKNEEQLGGVSGLRPRGGRRDRPRGHGVPGPHRRDRPGLRVPCAAPGLGRRFFGRPQLRARRGPGRWILCLDADERLSDAAALLPAILEAAPEVGGFLIERHDVVTHPEDGQTDVYPIGISGSSAIIRPSGTRVSSTSVRTRAWSGRS